MDDLPLEQMQLRGAACNSRRRMQLRVEAGNYEGLHATMRGAACNYEELQGLHATMRSKCNYDKQHVIMSGSM